MGKMIEKIILSRDLEYAGWSEAVTETDPALEAAWREGKEPHTLGIPFLKLFRGPDGTGTLKGSSERICLLHL